MNTRSQVVRYTTDTESVGRVVTTRAEELEADAVVFLSSPCLHFSDTIPFLSKWV